MVKCPVSTGHFCCITSSLFYARIFRNAFSQIHLFPLQSQSTNNHLSNIMQWPKFLRNNKTDTAALSRAASVPASVQVSERSYTPEKVFVEQQNGGLDKYEYSVMPPATIDKFWDLLNGSNSTQNLINLFYCLPEIYAPIHEIASRVADACWQLRKESTDEIDDKNKVFQKLFKEPNPLYAFRQFVYNAVCYEILTGRAFFYLNRPNTLGEDPESILSWYVLRSQKVTAIQKTVDYYSMTDISDMVVRYEEANNAGGQRVFEPNKVIPIINFSLETGYDINNAVPLLRGAEKAIKNLIPVYEARGIIYVKRGQLGFVVNRARDASGTIPMTDIEKLEMSKLNNEQYGITNGKEPYAFTSANVDFLRTSMSIQELQPFDETLADAVAIYRVLRVPRHLVPSKDNSTFANADSDMRSFYSDVIIPWAQRYAQAWTTGIGFRAQKRYVNASYDHVDILNADKDKKATTAKTNTETAILQYTNNIITKNKMLAMLGIDAIEGGDVYANDTQNPDPLAVKLGVGGVQALQAVLADQAISEEAKKNILIIIFGVLPKDAAKMVIAKPVEQVNPNDSNKNPSGGAPKNSGAAAQK